MTLQIAMVSSFVLLSSAALGAESDSPNLWRVSFTREFSRSPDRWTGLSECINSRDNFWAYSFLSKIEASPRQVDCSVDRFNNAVCVNSFERMPRTGAYNPEAREIVTSQVYAPGGEPIPVVYVFRLRLDEQRRPTSAATVVHYGLFQYWPRGIPRDEVEGKDRLTAFCKAEFDTTIGPPTAPFGQTPDAALAEATLRQMTEKSAENERQFKAQESVDWHAIIPPYVPRSQAPD